MASIEVRGYVNKPQSRTGSSGGFSTFVLSERIKDPKSEKGHRRVYYNVAWFESGTPPEDGSYVTIKGFLKPREYEQNGVKRMSLDITCKELEVSTSAKEAHGTKPAEAPADPWDH